MPRKTFGACVVLAACFVASSARADVESGPKVGVAAPALKAHATTGADAGKEVDFAEVRAKKPTIYVFIRGDQWSRPMARFLKSLDGSVRKVDERTAIVAVWLTEDVDGMKRHLPRVQESLKFESTTLSVYEKDKTGPNDWTVNPDAHLTAVVAADGMVAKTFGFVSVNDTLAPDVEAALKEAVKPQ